MKASRHYTYQGVCLSDLDEYYLNAVDEDGDIDILSMIHDCSIYIEKVEHPSLSDQQSDNEWYGEPNSSLTIYINEDNSEKFRIYIESIGFKLC